MRRSMVSKGKEAAVEAREAEDYFVDKIVSKYRRPRIVDSASLAEVGNKMAVDAGVGDVDITWKFVRVNKPFSISATHERTTMGEAGMADTITVFVGKGKMGYVPGRVQEPKLATRLFAGTKPTEGVVSKFITPSQSHIKRVMVHELGHIAVQPWATPAGRHMAHTSKFADWVESFIPKLTEVKKVKITPARKEASEIAKLRIGIIDKIEKDAKQQHLSDNEMRALLYNATNNIAKTNLHAMSTDHLIRISSNIKAMTDVSRVAGMETKIGMSASEANMLKKTSGSMPNYIALLRHNNNPLPKDSFFRLETIRQMKLDARTQREYKKIGGWRVFKEQERLSFANPRNFQAMRHYFDFLSRATGEPLLELKDKLEMSANIGRNEWHNLGKELLKTIGESQSKLANLPRDSQNKISNWLFFKTETLRKQLSPREHKIATALDSVLQGPGANVIRGIRWMNLNSIMRKYENRIERWKSAIQRIAPADVWKEGWDFTTKWIKDGRQAKADGTFDGWIAGQKWATRKVYYMSDEDWNKIAIDTITLTHEPTLQAFEKHVGKGEATWQPLFSRMERGTPLKGQNPYTAVRRHLLKAMRLYRMYDDFENFNSKISALDEHLNPQDRVALSIYRNSILGKFPDAGLVARAAIQVNRVWWEWGYTRQPTRLAYFVARNLVQNLAMAPGQLSFVEYTKAAGKIITHKSAEAITKINPWILDDFKKYFSTVVTQKRAMWEVLTLTDTSGRFSAVGVSRLMDYGGKVIPLSDEINRHIAWWPAHQMAFDNVKAFRQGKISSAKLWRRLKIHTMTPERKNILRKMILDNDDRGFINSYATDKVRNIHFVYDRVGRSLAEQETSNLPLIGLITWPRGAIDGYYQHAVKPIITGIYTHNGAQVYEGAKNLSSTVVGMVLAQSIMSNTIGTKGLVEPYGTYGALSYSPVSPGLSWMGKSAVLLTMAATLHEKGETGEDIANKLIKTASGQLEYLLPLVDAAKEWHEKTNNKEGVKLYHIIKHHLTKYDIAHDRLLKNNYQKFSDKWVTAFFGTEKKGKLD